MSAKEMNEREKIMESMIIALVATIMRTNKFIDGLQVTDEKHLEEKEALYKIYNESQLIKS